MTYFFFSYVASLDSTVLCMYFYSWKVTCTGYIFSGFLLPWADLQLTVLSFVVVCVTCTCFSTVHVLGEFVLSRGVRDTAGMPYGRAYHMVGERHSL